MDGENLKSISVFKAGIKRLQSGCMHTEHHMTNQGTIAIVRRSSLQERCHSFVAFAAF